MTNIAPVYSYAAPAGNSGSTAMTCSLGSNGGGATCPQAWFDLSTNLMKFNTAGSTPNWVATPAIFLGVVDETGTPTVDAVLSEPYRLNPYRRYELFGDGSSGAENLTSGTPTTVDGYQQYSTLTVNGSGTVLQHTQWTASNPTTGLILYSQNPVLVINSAAIKADGKGHAGVAGSTGAGGNGNIASCGGAGGGGGWGTNNGGTGGNRLAFFSVGNSAFGGGSAGTSGTPAGGAGLSAGTTGAPDPRWETFVNCFGGSGGADGGNTTSSATGGASGASGGAVYLRAPSVLLDSTSFMTANGNPGLQGNVTSGGTNDCSGSGGGGGGGSAVVAVGFFTNKGTFTASGGAGAGGTSGCAVNGGAGGNGGAGLAFSVKLW
ncbi:MAG TPA: hypothetical protein VMT20_11505 [Terriglobia bacterium]|nr:hypothetical protein [Terriglobia bacterium]